MPAKAARDASSPEVEVSAGCGTFLSIVLPATFCPSSESIADCCALVFGGIPVTHYPVHLQRNCCSGVPRVVLMLTNTTSYPDDALCSFYDASLNTACRALSSEDGPREDFAAFVEWTLARNGSPLTVSPEDDLARSTPDPEPSPPSPRGKGHQPEPTDDGEPFPAAICEPALSRATERMIVPEVEPNPSDQVREPATVPHHEGANRGRCERGVELRPLHRG